jgi:para-aminobenzoate synthetase/4-amino-4-deoxychorismate lyase
MGESITFDRVRDAPFVLLDDARVGMEGCARLYTAPREIVIARRPDEVAPALARIEALLSQGYAMAGHIGYEAGLALEPRLAPLADARSGADGPLIWMGAFDGWRDMSARRWPHGWECAKPNPAPRIGPMVPAIGAGAYAQAFDHIAEAIRAGDIYQANFTFPLTGPWSGDPWPLCPIARQRRGGHGGILFDGQYWLLSLSPELFFEAQGRQLRAKPMKGTRPRGSTPKATPHWPANCRKRQGSVGKPDDP